MVTMKHRMKRGQGAPYFTPELMTERLMALGYDVRVSCKGDVYRFEAHRPKTKYKSACHVVFVQHGKIVLPQHGEILCA